MRKIQLVSALAVLVAVCGLARSGDGDTRDLVVKAIKAMGGEKNLAKQQSMTWKEKGTYYGMGEGLPYTGVYAIQHPDKFRMEIEGVFIIVVNGDKGWTKAGDDVKEMSKEELELQQHNLRAGWVQSLLPLTGKEYKLTSLGEVKVEGQAALGVKATRKDYPDVKLYFDKKTHMLVKSEHMTKDPMTKKDVNAEAYFSGYKEVEGSQVPTKTTIKHDGKKFVEAEQFEILPGAKLSDKTFARP